MSISTKMVLSLRVRYLLIKIAIFKTNNFVDNTVKTSATEEIHSATVGSVLVERFFNVFISD